MSTGEIVDARTRRVVALTEKSRLLRADRLEGREAHAGVLALRPRGTPEADPPCAPGSLDSMSARCVRIGVIVLVAAGVISASASSATRGGVVVWGCDAGPGSVRPELRPMHDRAAGSQRRDGDRGRVRSQPRPQGRPRRRLGLPRQGRGRRTVSRSRGGEARRDGDRGRWLPQPCAEARRRSRLGLRGSRIGTDAGQCAVPAAAKSEVRAIAGGRSQSCGAEARRRSLVGAARAFPTRTRGNAASRRPPPPVWLRSQRASITASR